MENNINTVSQPVTPVATDPSSKKSFKGLIFGRCMLFIVISTIIAFSLGYTAMAMFLLALPFLLFPIIILLIACSLADKLFKNYKISVNASWLVAMIPALYVLAVSLASPPAGDDIPRNYTGGWIFLGDPKGYVAHSEHIAIVALLYFVFAIFPIIIGWKGTAVGQKDLNKFRLGNTLFALASVGLIVYTVL